MILPDTDIYLRQAEANPHDIVLGFSDAVSLRLYRYIARYLYGVAALRAIRENRGHAVEPRFEIETARDALAKLTRLRD